jgi:hypothetical protein
VVKPSVVLAPKCVAALCALLLAACIQDAASASTLAPSPMPTATIPIVESSSPTVSIAKTNNQAIFVAEIGILSPGPDSRLISPIQLQAQLEPGAGGKVRIELFGSDGRLLARKILVYDAAAHAELDASVDFEISRASETARLVMSTEDEYGRLQALNSVELVLLSAGEQVLNLPAASSQEISISSPTDNEQIAGGTLTVTGSANIPAGRPLTIQLITREGRVLAFNVVYPTFSEDQTLGTFEINLPYRVKETTWVQIAITESGGSIPGPVHFVSVEVQLAP